jgi:hypothetical protein
MVINEKILQRKFTISQQIFLAFPTNSPAGIDRGLNVSEKQRVNKYSPESLLFMDVKMES